MGEARAQGRPGRKHVWGSAGPGQRPARGRRRAARLAWPRRGPAGPHLRPIPTFRHFREKLNDSLVSRTASSSSTLSTPLACPARPLHREWARGAGALAALLSPWTCVCVRVCVSVCTWDSPSAVLVVASRFRKKEQERNAGIHLSLKWSFAAKKSVVNSTGAGGKAAAAMRFAER